MEVVISLTGMMQTSKPVVSMPGSDFYLQRDSFQSFTLTLLLVKFLCVQFLLGAFTLSAGFDIFDKVLLISAVKWDN